MLCCNVRKISLTFSRNGVRGRKHKKNTTMWMMWYFQHLCFRTSGDETSRQLYWCLLGKLKHWTILFTVQAILFRVFFLVMFRFLHTRRRANLYSISVTNGFTNFASLRNRLGACRQSHSSPCLADEKTYAYVYITWLVVELSLTLTQLHVRK